MKTFEYGHSSNANISNLQGASIEVGKNKKKNKRKKNNKGGSNDIAGGQQQFQNQNQYKKPNQYQNQNQYQNTNLQNQIRQQQQFGNNQLQNQANVNEVMDDTKNLNADADTQQHQGQQDLETDDEICKSPRAPPPPMFSSNQPFTPVQSNTSAKPTSIFPSTAAANDNLTKSSADHVQMVFPSVENRNTITIDEILLHPGRLTRPKKICMILRGPPGSGKSYVARCIKDKEVEMGGPNPRILSIDDYFLVENEYDEKCPKTGRKIKKKEIIYEYDKEMEETYMQYLIKAFKKTVADQLYDFIIVDCNNNSLRTLNEFYCHAKDSGFAPYIIDLLCDLATCLSTNIHNRSEQDIKQIIDSHKATPFHYIKLDVGSLLDNAVEMEDADDMVTESEPPGNATGEGSGGVTEAAADTADETAVSGVENADGDEDCSEPASAPCGFLKSKWETDASSENLARLDGVSKTKAKRSAATMEDFLQMNDWEPPKTSADGKKRVRWADIEEKRAQDKMRAIGFVVGQTDWSRMMDPHAGNRALNRTKYIERVNKRR